MSQLQWSDLGGVDPRDRIPSHAKGDLVQYQHGQGEVGRRRRVHGNADGEEDQ